MVVKRTMDEMITHFNDVVSEMNIPRKDKMTLLGMITAIGIEYQQAADAIEDLEKLTDAQLDIIKQYQGYLTKHRWIPVTERLPEENGMYLVHGKWSASGRKVTDIIPAEEGE